jgi:PAS domain S-box-containing protein
MWRNIWYYLRMDANSNPHLPRLLDDLSARNLVTLFDFLPEVFLYVKDKESRFVHVNEAWCKMRGFKSVDEVIGLNDLDLHPRYLAEQYIKEDQKVMESKVPLPNQVWLVPGENQQMKWFISSKTPLFNSAKEVIGIAGVMRDLQQMKTVYHPYHELEKALNHVLKNYHEPLRIVDLAEMSFLSVSQFDRRFKALYQMTPQQYVLKVRLNAACYALTHSENSIAQISAGCGFYDQSYFTKQFKRHIGILPINYRQQFRLLPEPKQMQPEYPSP